MQEINFELRKKLKLAVEDYTSYIEEQEDGKIPTSEYFIPGEKGMEKQEIPNMSKLPEFYEEKRPEFFRDLAKWFITSGNSYNQKSIFKKIEKEDHISYQSIKAEEAEMDQIITQYESDFSSFAGQVLDYAGSYDFDSDDYDRAFEDFFGERYDKKTWEKHILPISNLEVEDSISLEEDISWLNNADIENISIEIDDITDSELAAIRSSQNNFATKSTLRSYGYDWKSIIRIEFNGSLLTNKLVESIITSLRLFSPTSSEIHSGKIYMIEKTGKTYREGIEDCVGVSPIENPTSGVNPRNWQSLDNESEFREFWSEYRNYLNLSQAEEKAGKLSGALRRFNESYLKHNLEDKIVDIVIAFESTLLRDVPKNSSYSFRLGLRAGLLLEDFVDYDREVIRNLFKNLYYTRGEIVHQDRELTEIQQDDQFQEIDAVSSEENISDYRLLLAKSIIKYFDLINEYSLSITQINQKLDQAVWETASFELGNNEYDD
ncbi:HEPN domain-containing protein [Halorussus aquaticus]|uniref:HEPN domain-containing protein n=1 Tax=Halorussus aquaticus TaxID=2953748 RepID=A0ABD5Q2N9_9EURY|nr:HEPN domain-containing protein [Halorussus aquaticus]